MLERAEQRPGRRPSLSRMVDSPGREAMIDARRLFETFDALREGIQILSPDWRYLYVNEGVARHGRKSRHELLGRTLLECYPGIERTHGFEVLERCMRERQSATLENEFEYDDGRRAWFEVRIQPCPEGLIVLSLDITERKRLEATLLAGEKLRALGHMAAGVAHDLKNILNPIVLQLQLLRRRVVGHDADSDEIFARIENALRTGADTVERLRTFSRQEPDRAAEPIDLNRLTDAALAICLPRIREHAGIEVRRERNDAPPVLVRASELVNAVVNLVMNAIDVTPPGGTIAVRTGSDAGSWIEVADDGPGMSPDIESRMFEPFFTTKPQGTGLGLATVYAFVKRHGGRVSVDTAPGRGTTVRLWFPAVAAAPVTAGPRSVRRAESRRVLVVEDERASREALQMLLDEEGFAVDAAASGEEALARLAACQPDVLVVDFRLPGIDGASVARAARERNARLPVVMMSGLDESSGALSGVLREPRTEHVRKPVDIDRLVAALERMLAPAARDAGGSPPSE